MPEILTESFCERCGTRYTFESARPKVRLKGVKVLSRGLKNFVLSDDTTMDEAMAAARSETDRESTAHQLDAFHKTFSFCMSCRQYTCPNCWNEVEARCQSCAPLPEAEVAPTAFPNLTTLTGSTTIVAQPIAATNGHGEDAATAEPASKAVDQTGSLLQRFRPGQSLDEELAAFEREQLGSGADTAEPRAAESVAAEVGLRLEPIADDASVEPEQVQAEAVAEPVQVEAVAEPVGIEAVAEPVGIAAEPAAAVAEPALIEVGPEPEPAIAAVIQPEPAAELVLAAEPAPVVAPSEPEPVIALEPEPELVAAEPEALLEPAFAAEPEPETEPVVASEPEPEPILTAQPEPPVEPEREPVAASAADVVEQPTWRITAPDVQGSPATPPSDAAVGPIQPSTASTPKVEPQWPVRPEWPTVQASTGLPFLGRPAQPQGGVESLWAASNRELVTTPPAPGRATSGIQPCVSCGLSLSANARFCRRCGTLQSS